MEAASASSFSSSSFSSIFSSSSFIVDISELEDPCSPSCSSSSFSSSSVAAAAAAEATGNGNVDSIVDPSSPYPSPLSFMIICCGSRCKKAVAAAAETRLFSDDHGPPRHFLDSCFLCKRRISMNSDVFMYRTQLFSTSLPVAVREFEDLPTSRTLSKLKKLIAMVITWIILLLAAMVHTRDTVKPKRAKKAKFTKDDSNTDSETESIDRDDLQGEATAPTASKGKAHAETAKAPPTATDKGKALMTSSSISLKRRRLARRIGRARGIEINEPCQEETKHIPQIDTESEDEEDWDTFLTEVQQGIDEENKVYLKNKKAQKSSSICKQQAKKKNIPRNESLDNSHSLPRRSPRNEGQTAPSIVTQRSSTFRKFDQKKNLESPIIQEQHKMALELRKMSEDIHQMKQQCSTISGMLKGILKKMGCTSSEDSTSDDSD